MCIEKHLVEYEKTQCYSELNCPAKLCVSSVFSKHSHSLSFWWWPMIWRWKIFIRMHTINYYQIFDYSIDDQSKIEWSSYFTWLYLCTYIWYGSFWWIYLRICGAFAFCLEISIDSRLSLMNCLTGWKYRKYYEIEDKSLLEEIVRYDYEVKRKYLLVDLINQIDDGELLKSFLKNLWCCQISLAAYALFAECITWRIIAYHITIHAMSLRRQECLWDINNTLRSFVAKYFNLQLN